MTAHRLGTTEITRPVDGELVRVRVPVFVLWLDGPMSVALETLAAASQACPACDMPIPFARPGGILQSVAETPNCGHVSDQCAACGAQLYFDTTPADGRARLRWPARAVDGQD